MVLNVRTRVELWEIIKCSSYKYGVICRGTYTSIYLSLIYICVTWNIFFIHNMGVIKNFTSHFKRKC